MGNVFQDVYFNMAKSRVELFLPLWAFSPSLPRPRPANEARIDPEKLKNLFLAQRRISNHIRLLQYRASNHISNTTTISSPHPLPSPPLPYHGLCYSVYVVKHYNNPSFDFPTRQLTCFQTTSIDIQISP